MGMKATTHRLDESDLPDAFMFLTIPGLYDGWSVAIKHGGEYINRWPPTDHRHVPTQEWINERIKEDAQFGAVPDPENNEYHHKAEEGEAKA